MPVLLWLSFLLLFVSFCHDTVTAQTEYYGKFIGDFETPAHGVKGRVYIANENTIFIKDFEYDGLGSDTFFWGDKEEHPTSKGFVIPLENGTTNDVLKKYSGQNLILILPDGKLTEIKSLSVWSRELQINFGSISIHTNDLPREKSLGPLPTLAHRVRSDDVIILDSKTIFISNLYYDGAGPDAFFLAGKGVKPHSQGMKIPDENGSLQKIRGYSGENVTLHFPGNLTVFDVSWFGLYCIRFEQNFGHVNLPEQANVPANMEDLRIAASMLIETTTTTHDRLEETAAVSKYSDGVYYGKPIADFKTNAHDVKGTVFAASDDTFYILNFIYDGEGPDAFFWAGKTEKPSPEGFIVPDEFGTKQVLGKYTGQNIAITLPDGKKISDIKWLGVWCRKFAANFGYITIPNHFDPPKAMPLGPLSSLAHGVGSKNVVVKDTKTIVIMDFHYDGSAPDAFFLVGTGNSPSAVGTKVPDENGSLQTLRGYQGKDIELRLPSDTTVFDVDWLSVFCISYQQNFGDIRLPKYMNIPADLKSLKAEITKDMKFDNCEELFPGIFHVSWKILGQDLIIQMMARTEENEYISFGRSGNDNRAMMIGADVAVAFFDSKANQAIITDYHLSAKSQCSQGSGACPDSKLGGSDNTELMNWERSDGVFKVVYKRPLASSDSQDLSIPVSIPVSVIAAIGPLNSLNEVAFHTRYYTKDSKKIHFGRTPPQDRCSPLTSGGGNPSMTTSKPRPWPPTTLEGTTTFRAQIGPTGGDKGYTSVTGHQSWGIAWWMNGLLIPEITVQRGTNYTFIVEGGNNPSNSASYHPLYLTNNPEGGGSQFQNQLGLPHHIVYAGLDQRDMPIGVGRLCEYKHKTVDKSAESDTFEEYKKTLVLDCNDGSPGIFHWIPDGNTPDVVYYQCFTHRNLGWKIHVVDGDDNLNEVAGTMEHLSNVAPSSAPSIAASFYLIMLVILTTFF